MAAVQTKTDLEMERRMMAVEDDPERVDALGKARAFKRSWLELGEVLTRVYERQSWSRWGYASFDEYAKKELHLQKSTTTKLLGSFRFLKASAPGVLERAQAQPAAPVPSLNAVNFVARAEENGAADETTLMEIRRAAFDEGTSAPALARRYKSVAFPVNADEQAARVRTQLAATAKRMVALLADPACPVDEQVGASVEEAVGHLLAELTAQDSHAQA